MEAATWCRKKGEDSFEVRLAGKRQQCITQEAENEESWKGEIIARIVGGY